MKNNKCPQCTTGLAVAYGVAFGSIVFAMTDQPYWIAGGAALGVLYAAIKNLK